MISLLNRREVTVTHDTNRLNQLREKLDGAGIEHIVRNKRNRTFTAGRSHGVPNVDADYAYEYGIYVHRDDVSVKWQKKTEPQDKAQFQKSIVLL